MDTICAISTPQGVGGISVIRVSGEEAFLVCENIFKGNKKIAETAGYSCIYGKIFDTEFIDDVILAIFRTPMSYTGENTVEISCHGSIAVTQKILRLLLKNGCRMAKAGEFTRRAFENGKLSLIDAETVGEVIASETETELKFANTLRLGMTYKKITELKERLLDVCAILAVWADYPDDNDLNIAELTENLQNISLDMSNLLKTYDYGRRIKNGIRTVIAGKPNVGKSSLMNALIGYSRSIVTDIAGTTRDIIEEKINLGAVTLNLADTAGIRHTDNEIEKIGVELSENAIENAEFILAVFDNSKPLTKEDFSLIERIKNRKTIYVLNKSDLPKLCELDGVEISAKKGDISLLQEKITKLFDENEISVDNGLLANERQREALSSSLNAVAEAKNALENDFTLDIVSVLLDESCDFLLELLGEKITDEVANRVFEKFCVGK